MMRSFLKFSKIEVMIFPMRMCYAEWLDEGMKRFTIDLATVNGNEVIFGCSLYQTNEAMPSMKVAKREIKIK